MDIEEGLERCRWRMGRQVQRVMSWVRGIDDMGLQRYAATGRRWGKIADTDWAVSGSDRA